MDLKYIALFVAISFASECTIPNLSIGDFNITSEKQLRNLTKTDDLFIIAVSAK